MTKSKESSKQRTARLKAGAKLLSEKIKLEKQYLKKKEFEAKQKEKAAKKWSSLKKILSKKITYKRGKSQRATLNISDKEIPGVLEDENRFFKNEMEEVKKTMFFK